MPDVEDASEHSQMMEYSNGAYDMMRLNLKEVMHIKDSDNSRGELTFFLGLHVKQQPDGIFISQDKYVADILKKFNFCSIKTATTPIESNKPLVKDEDGVEVDVHEYQSMIGSLMYLTASRPAIMFAVCACARFQVIPKASRLHAVKRIFRYLKHQPKLGLWYPRDSPFELEAFSDSNYAGASLDRKSTTSGSAHCCGQVLWIQNQLMDYGFNFMNTKIYIDNESTKKSTDFVTPTKASREAQEEEISPTILEATKTLSKVASQGVSKEKSTDKGKRYRRRARSVAKNINIGLDAEEEINTGVKDVNTGSTKVDSGTASKRGQREGKALMIEEDIHATHKTKEQMRQEEAGLEDAIKLQAQLDEEVAKQIHLDKMDAIKAKLEANAELTKDVLGKNLPEQDFAKGMAEMIDTFVPINLKATKAKLKRYGEELQTKTSKKQRFDDKDVPAIRDKVAEVKEEEPVKRTGKRKKQKARKGVILSVDGW
ncbi:hypothetical protein Tco_1215302 [Tanacetum coccineum]